MAGQVFRSEDTPAGIDAERFGQRVHIWLGENGPGRTLKIRAADALKVVTVDDADPIERGDSQILAQIGQHVARFHIEAGPLFHKKTFYAGHWQNSFSLNHSDIRL